MRTQVTVQRALLLRMLCFTNGTAGLMDALHTIREEIEAALRDALGPDGEGPVYQFQDKGGFAIDDEATLAREVYLELNTNRLRALIDALSQRVWPDLPTIMAADVRGFGPWLSELLDDAQALEAFERLPQEQRERAIEYYLEAVEMP